MTYVTVKPFAPTVQTKFVLDATNGTPLSFIVVLTVAVKPPLLKVSPSTGRFEMVGGLGVA